VLATLERGVVLEDGPGRVDRARRLGGEGPALTWLELTLSEGRYREVKRLCRAVGLTVQRLRRVAFGSLELGELPSGQWRELAPAEVASLAESGENRRGGPGPVG
jgi:23S rRNA pseudouridine2605 synthase